MSLRAASAILAWSTAAACAAPEPTVDAGLRQTITLTQTLPPDVEEEGIFHASPGDAIGLVLDAPSADLDWDIHAHNGGGTQDVANGLGEMSMTYDFHPPDHGPWYLLIRNHAVTALPIDIHIDLYGNATWQGWQ